MTMEKIYEWLEEKVESRALGLGTANRRGKGAIAVSCGLEECGQLF